MYEIGNRFVGIQTFRTHDPNISINMVPGVTYQAIYNADITSSGWELDAYNALSDELAAHGCELTYFGVCHTNNRIITQWQLDPQSHAFQSAVLPAIPAAVIILAALGVLGAGIGSISLFKLSEMCEDAVNPGLIVGGIVLVGALVGAGYFIRSLK